MFDERAIANVHKTMAISKYCPYISFLQNVCDCEIIFRNGLATES